MTSISLSFLKLRNWSMSNLHMKLSPERRRCGELSLSSQSTCSSHPKSGLVFTLSIWGRGGWVVVICQREHGLCGSALPNLWSEFRVINPHAQRCSIGPIFHLCPRKLSEEEKVAVSGYWRPEQISEFSWNLDLQPLCLLSSTNTHVSTRNNLKNRKRTDMLVSYS